MATQRSTAEDRHVHANGTDIHYVEAGQGPPLLLLHGGLLSNQPMWAGHPSAYVSRMGPLTDRFRVIAPDTRGHGRTASPTRGPISYAQLADDVLALIAALGLERPMLCGFSDGGMVATLVAIRAPGLVKALVNDAGFDLLHPEAPSFAMTRQIFGGGTDATVAAPQRIEQFFTANPAHGFLDRLKADHGGAGAWKTTLAEIFDRLATPSGTTFEDLRRITAPTLVLTGDRDFCCSVEDAVTAFRMLPQGELAILPGEGHEIPDSAITTTARFLQRHID